MTQAGGGARAVSPPGLTARAPALPAFAVATAALAGLAWVVSGDARSGGGAVRGRR